MDIQAPRGKVYLVGAGPGDPGLLTLRGAECLARADLVLYDYLVNPAILGHAPPSAELVSLGHPHGGRGMQQAEVNRQMVEAARQGKTVVRLKSGDPHLFGRGAEETELLHAAGVPCEVVPGVTAAMAAASHAGVPLTHRDCASAVALITGHQRTDKSTGPELDYESLARFPGTLVFYMAMTTAQQWSEALVRGGRPAETPVAIVRRASWPDQEVVRTTLADVAAVIRSRHLRPPAVIVVGEVVALGLSELSGDCLGSPLPSGEGQGVRGAGYRVAPPHPGPLPEG
ncbi:MAG: uroporphyrinogen-III C-methyltransferase, partial [Thermoguttaceae bacterium]